MGTTGAGKTTITRLLFRFYDVVSGDDGNKEAKNMVFVFLNVVSVMTSWVRRTPARLFWLIARHFLSDMVEPPPDCRYCRRWPSSGSLDCCTLCRCCFQLSRFSHDPSLTPERYDNLVSRLTGVLGELTVHSSFPLHLGRSESPRGNRGHHTHRRAPSPSRSPSSPSPRHSPRAAGGRDRRSRSSGRRSEREHQHEREAWAPTLRHQRNPERGEHQGFASRSPASGGNRIPSPPPPPRKTRIELKPPPTPPPRRSESDRASQFDQGQAASKIPPTPPPPNRTGGATPGPKTTVEARGKGKGKAKSKKGFTASPEIPKKKKKNRGVKRLAYWAERLAQKGRGKGSSQAAAGTEAPEREVSPEDTSAADTGERGSADQALAERADRWADASEETGS